MMPDAATSPMITLRVDYAAAMASAGDLQWPVARPADLVTLIGNSFAGQWVHLADGHVTPDPAGLGAAMDQARWRGVDAVIGRLLYSGGERSPLLQRLPGLAYQPVAPGTVLANAAALARIGGHSLSPTWDAFWLRDIALSLWWSASVAGLDLTLAKSSSVRGNAVRLPPGRATLMADPPKPVDRTILLYGRMGASTSLYFDGLAAAFPGTLRYLEPGDLFSDLPWLASAGLVVVVRGFEFALANGAMERRAELGTPVVWFTDDDFTALGSEEASLGHYDTSALQSFCRGLAAIVASSAPLAARLSSLHAEVMTLPPVIDLSLIDRRPAKARTTLAAVIGGRFRAASLRRDVMPAAQRAGLQLCVSSAIGVRSRDIRLLPFFQDFRQFVPAWQREAPSILLHPFGDTANIGNKSAATLLCAAYFGAVPVVGDEPAYAMFNEADGVLKAARDPDDWYRQLARLAQPEVCLEMQTRLQRWARDKCGVESARPVFERLLAQAHSGGAFAAEERLGQAVASRTLQRILPRQSKIVGRARKLLTFAERRLNLLRRLRG